jgi:hypothetical protein
VPDTDEGRTEHAQQALRAYDAHAPDNPLAELRRSVTRTLDSHRAAKNKTSQPAREEVAR